MTDYYYSASAILDKAISTDSYFQIKSILFGLKAADVVEVVRCDHCERRYEEDGEYFCSRTDMPCADDDFCSHGARMDKEDEIYG